MVDEKKESVDFTKEELEAINKDIDTAKQSLSSKSQDEEKAKIKEQLRKELEEENKAKMEQEAKDAKIAELEKQLQEVQSKTSDTLSDLQKKLDDSISSKQVINQKSPFTGNKEEIEQILKDPQKVREIEEASKEAFLNAMRNRTF